MKLTTQAKIVFYIAVPFILGILFYYDNISIPFNISLSNLFACTLTLLGFLFATRTFIVFKLQDAVYSKDEYRALQKKLKDNNHTKQELYSPLKNLDEALSTSINMCFTSVLFILIASLLPCIPEKYIYFYLCAILLKNFIFLYLLFTLFEIFRCLKAVDKNIKQIILRWENEAKQ